MTPRPYQLEGRDFLAPRRHAMLADMMRVGKTAQAILAAHKAGAQSLLVCTPAIAVEQWEQEIERWWPSGPLPEFRVKSWDMASRLWRMGYCPKVDVFIPDEAHFAGNPTARRTRMVYHKDGIGARAGALWPLSGTPAPRHAGQLWPMLAHFGVVKCTYEDFLRAYCWPRGGDWSSGQVGGTRESAIPELRALLATVLLRRTIRDVCPEMPDIRYDLLPVEGAPPEGVEIPTGETLLDWLDGHSDELHEIRISTAMAKVPALVDRLSFLCDNTVNGPFVVVGFHQQPLETVAAGLTAAGITAAVLNGKTPQGARRKIQAALRDGSLQVVCANVLTAGTAIDLSTARTGYMLELDWVAANNQQAAMRLLNLEKLDPVTWNVVTLPGSFDERIQSVLTRQVRELSKLY